MNNMKKTKKHAETPKQKARRLHPYCAFNGTTENLSTHHLVGQAYGGSNDQKNFIVLSRPVHDMVENGEITIGIAY